MMSNKIKNKKYALLQCKLCLFVIILSVALFLPERRPAEAVYCLVFPCSGVYSKVFEKVMAGLLSEAKQQAAETINEMVMGSAKKSVITDYDDFLYKNAKDNAKNVVNDYVTNSIAKGKGSLANYIPKDVADKLKKVALNKSNGYEGVGQDAFLNGLAQNDDAFINAVKAGTIDLKSLSNLTGIKDNYVNQLIEGAKEATFGKSSPAVSYIGNPSDMFKDSKNGFKNLSAYTSGINNPWAFKSDAAAKYEKAEEQTTKKAEVMAIAGQGFVGKIKDGIVQTPGSVFAGTTVNTLNIGNDIMTGARDIMEVVIAAVTKLASGAVNQAMTTARSSMQDNINKKITSVKKTISGT